MTDKSKKYDIELDILNEETIKKIENDICPVCNSVFEINDEAAAGKCGHIFHADCLGKWLSQKDTCPICREFLDRELYKDSRNESRRKLRIEKDEITVQKEFEKNKTMIQYYLRKGMGRTKKKELITILKVEGNIKSSSLFTS